ncbi:MAG: PD-(D/E)XK nuclease family protein [Clostridia bacterium]|nr:PD-(D/E)XK nuclease family protein [Clostridia bacterium]
MLNIVYGKAGSGKTKYVHEILASLAGEGCEDLLLVVPEQFSFSAERAMLELLGPVDCNKVEVVMSFSHIADTVRKEYGSEKLNEIGSLQKVLLMSMAIKQVSDKLEFFSRRVKSKGFISQMISLCDEFKQNALSPYAAMDFSQNLESETLKKKLGEVSLILQAYDALMQNRFSDPFDVLTRLYDVLGEYDFFRNKTIVIDGFYSFSRQELKIIERMISQAKEVYITVCADKIFASEEELYDVFSYPRKTAGTVIDIAKKCNKEIRKIEVKNNRRKSEELLFLEENIFRTEQKEWNEPTEDIEIISAKNIENESRFVALTVKKLISDGKYRSKDIAVVSRNGGEYDIEVKEAFKRYGIEVFSDRRQPVKIQPLCTYILGALEIAAFGFSEERVMKCLKTGLTDLDTNEVSELENYAVSWGNSARFTMEWTENPRGFGEEFTENDKQELGKLNALRKTASEPLQRFRKALSDNVTGKKAAEEIFKLLINVHADENLKNIAINLEESDERELALEQERIWEIVMNLLDALAEVMADEAKSASEIYELVNIIISNEDIGVLPQGLDEVLVGNAERTRVASPKVVFVVGANEGVFPRTPHNDGVFTDRERNILLTSGMPLNVPVLDRILEERFIAYHTLCSAVEKVYVSYCAKSFSEELYPSEIVSEIKAIFPALKITDAEKTDVYDFVCSETTAFEALTKTWTSSAPKTNALKAYFEDKEEYKRKTDAVRTYLSDKKIQIDDSTKAKELFGKNMYLSASRIETYYKCPFEYFCKFGLKARPEEKAEINPRQRGTVVHYCLEKIISRYGIDALKEMDKKELKKIISEVLNEYIEISMGGKENKSSRFTFLYARFEKTVFALISQIIDEFSVSDFVPCGYEVKIDRDGEIPPYEILLEDGKISVRGLVDRVDMMVTEDNKYLRVVDYKTGSKEFKLQDVLDGLNMQMLIYLFAVTQNGKDKYADCQPAGILYKPASFNHIKANRYDTDEELEKQRSRSGRYSGLVLANAEVIYGMDKTESGNIVNALVKENKDNSISFEGSVATAVQLGKIKQKVDSIIAEMGNELHRGNVEVLPYDGACDYCDYKDVCLRSEDDKIREKTVSGKTDVFQFFEKAGAEDGGDKVD